MAGRLRQPTGRYGGRSAEERQAERRRRFLDAALQLFGDSPGFRSTTVAGLSEAAGLSTRQFYEEFRTLEDVLAALHLQVNDWAETAASAALAEARDLPLAERATAVFRAYAANVTCDPRRIRITFVEIIGVSPGWRSSGSNAVPDGWTSSAPRPPTLQRGRGGPARLPDRGHGVHRQRQRSAARLAGRLGGRDPGRDRGRAGPATARDPAAGCLRRPGDRFRARGLIGARGAAFGRRGPPGGRGVDGPPAVPPAPGRRRRAGLPRTPRAGAGVGPGRRVRPLPRRSRRAGS